MNEGMMTRKSRGPRQRGVTNDTVTTKFLRDFDPEQSEREKRKLNRRLHHGNRKAALFDERGRIIATGEDLCDCLDRGCPGCHFNCPKCGSKKCGHECRNNRKWMYESIENEGSDNVIKNKNIPS